MNNLRVNPGRIAADLAALAAITDPDRPWTRRAFSPRFDEGRAWLARRLAEAGLAVATDAGGNLLGRRRGRGGAGTILLGSHSDTVPDGGRFDGVAGVVVALEVARMLAERGHVLRHDLCIADFLAEEVSVFGVSCIGSRAMAGVRPEGWLTLEHQGRSLAQAIRDVGGDPAADARATDLRAFFELHIEQGPVLEDGRIDIGLVTAIAGITRVEIVLTGRPDHAGTAPMDRRADALVAAAALVTAIAAEARGLAAGGAHFTATVGEFSITPGAANVVPGGGAAPDRRPCGGASDDGGLPALARCAAGRPAPRHRRRATHPVRQPPGAHGPGAHRVARRRGSGLRGKPSAHGIGRRA